MVIWIGYLQWMRDNGFAEPRQPILDPLETIECRDASLEFDGQSKLPAAAQWPDADFIIGNPPFLGSKLFRKFGLEDDYIDAMYTAYEIPNTSDLCCYWFERVRMVIEQHQRMLHNPTGNPAFLIMLSGHASALFVP